MPRLTRALVKASFLYLVAALFTGILLALPDTWPSLRPVYFHLFLVGWISQLIFGTAFWLFPKDREREAFHTRIGWAILVLLNVGLLLRALAEPANATQPGVLWGWLLVLSALCQWLAGVGFIIIAWPRSRQRRRRHARS